MTLALCLLGTPLPAQERPADATVLIRVTADVSAVLTDASGAAAKEIELPGAQIVTGSGLIVSRFGYVVTNHHVVAGGEIKGRIQGVPATVTVTVRRVEVRLPPESRGGQPATHLDASIVVADPDLDLAILAIPGNDLPYVPLGDSDALASGQPVSVVGYPLGSELDLGRASGEEATAPAVGAGIVSALREDANGNIRYIQTTAPLNRGNSGGPLLDRHGFATGIVQMKVTGAESIGFAIPINLVKAFLARNGIDSMLPATALSPGPVFDAPDKSIRIQVPNGFEDQADSRLRVDSGASLPGVALRIDRVASAWSVDRLEEELRAGRAFERYPTTGVDAPARHDRVLRGQGTGRADGRSFRLLYAVLDLDDEKIVARYIGSAEQIAFNESVLSASLASLQAAPMLAPDSARAQHSGWAKLSTGPLAEVVAVVPAGWTVEPGAPRSCVGVAAPGASLLASPRHDFRISIRGGQHDSALDPPEAAARCAGRKGSASGDEYRYVFSSFGVDYTVAGRFQRSGAKTLQLEVAAPTSLFEPARALFSKWLEELNTASKPVQ